MTRTDGPVAVPQRRVVVAVLRCRCGSCSLLQASPSLAGEQVEQVAGDPPARGGRVVDDRWGWRRGGCREPPAR